MPRRLPLILAVLMAATVLTVPLVAGAHTSCVTDDDGDAPAGYDIGEMCVSGGDEDPAEFSAFLDSLADDVTIVWDAGAWAISHGPDGTITVTVLDSATDCPDAAATVDGSLVEVTVPGTCIPNGLAEVVGQTYDAEAALQDETGPAVGGIENEAAEGEGGHGGHGGEMPADGFTRIAGGSRIETAVAISADAWADGAPAVLLANADNPVDALPASRARYEGPILYVPACGELPAVVAEEIARLQPADIIVLGGATAVCDDIATAAVAARDAAAPEPERVEGTPNADAVPADEQDGDVRSAEFVLLDTRPTEGYEEAAGEAHIARSEAGVTVTIRVTGLLPDTMYVSHVHDGACNEGGGAHFKFDPDGVDTPPNEIHLPFTSDAEGAGTQTSTHTEVPGEDARSIVVHPRDNGPARVMCAEWPAT